MLKYVQSETRNPSSTYTLLPFRFIKLKNKNDLLILVNDIGEYVFLPNTTFNQFISHKLDSSSKYFYELKSKYFLTDNLTPSLIELISNRYRMKMSFVEGFTKLHTFVTTLRCDHSCKYCQVSRVSEDKVKYDMSKETARKSVELMFQSPSKSITMEFQGGESLLNFELIKYIVEYSEELNKTYQKHIDKVIATNLSPLTDEMLYYCKEKNIGISTSLDGPELLHNQNRPKRNNDSYEITIRNIKRAREVLGIENVAALMTTTKLSLEYPIEIIDEYIKQDFKSIFLRSISPYGFAVKSERITGYEIENFLEFYKKGLKYILDLNKKGIDFSESYARIILTKILTPFPSRYVDLQSPAGAGISVVIYNYDGDVYATDESRMLAEMGDKRFKLGNVHKHTYKEIFTSPALMSTMAASCVETLPGCSDCAFQSYCGADPVFHHATQGDIFGHRPTSNHCKKNMEIIQHLFEYIESGDEQILKIFLSWIRGVSVKELVGVA